MANIVLVHGAWHGGWCYRDTAKALRGMGHTVFTPTHTGLGERVHQGGEAVTLETHIRDVAGVIEAEELTDVVLCGHSYGGMVITGVADRMADKIAALVYIDAFVPKDGDSLTGLIAKALPPEQASIFLDMFFGGARNGNSGMMGAIPAAVFQVKPEHHAWVDRRCVPQAFATFTSPALLNGGGASIARKMFILATGWQPSPFVAAAAAAEGQPGWRVERMAVGHDIMVDEPEALAKLIAEMA